jgi:hypothetical protein
MGYEDDFFLWTIQQAAVLRAGQLSKLDLVNLAEEIESLGRRDRRELADRIRKLIAELLKWHCDPGARCGYWRAAIRQQRYEIELILRDSPSLRQFVRDEFPRIYTEAREDVIDELRLLQPDFGPECPFTPEQILADNFLPE